jgi:hypothetical protein
MPITHRLVAAALIGTSGTLVMLAMFWPNWGLDWPLIPGAAIGASCAGYALADFFGHPGQTGFGFGLAGAVLATLCGAALAGLGFGIVLAQPLAGVVFGPIAVGQALLVSPPTLATWIATMTFANLAMGRLRTRHLMPS